MTQSRNPMDHKEHKAMHIGRKARAAYVNKRIEKRARQAKRNSEAAKSPQQTELTLKVVKGPGSGK